MNAPGTSAASGARILLVEDEIPMRRAISDALAADGYRVIEAVDGVQGLDKARAETPDLILLDIMMPRLDGYALCTELRRLGIRTPILMLTAKGRIEDRVEGLDSGADDYLVKPFSLEELLARVRAMLRRTRAVPGAAQDSIVLGEITLDFKRLQARSGKRDLHLTQKEWAMLRLLAAEAGQPVSRERFLDVVWGYASFPTTRTVDTHIASLRAKLEPNPESPRWIHTVHGAGYRLALD